jgi:hypothetical protein
MSIACPSVRFRGMHSRPTFDPGRLILLLSSCSFAASIRSSCSSSKRMSSKSESSEDDESSIKNSAHLLSGICEWGGVLATVGGCGDRRCRGTAAYLRSRGRAAGIRQRRWRAPQCVHRETVGMEAGVGVACPRSESARGLTEQPRSAAAAGGAEGISQRRR